MSTIKKDKHHEHAPRARVTKAHGGGLIVCWMVRTVLCKGEKIGRLREIEMEIRLACQVSDQ
jgi:hypothetical protein